MRIIAIRTIKNGYKKFPDAKQSLLAWNEEVEIADWKNPNELKVQHASASIINTKRVVFNIHGNKFRLVVDIEYRLGIVFVVWFGSHKSYDQIDVKTIKYDKAN
jgi:mRNA interferase HigB